MSSRPRSRQRGERIVESVVTEVRSRPAAGHSIADVANRHHLSAEYFHRLFRRLYGAPFAAFVQRVRLDLAVARMRAEPERRLTAIALDVGFNDLSELSRAFKRRFGCPPSRWDRCTALNRVKLSQAPDPLEAIVSDLFPATPATTALGVAMQQIGAERMASLQVPQPHINANLGVGFDRLEAWLAARGQIRDGRHFVGMSSDSPLDTAAHEWRFRLGYPVDDAIEGSAEILVQEHPAMLAATKSCAGGVGSFVEAWDALRRRWLPDSGFVLSAHPAREVYLSDPRPHGFAWWEILCVLPVRNSHTPTV